MTPDEHPQTEAHADQAPADSSLEHLDGAGQRGARLAEFSIKRPVTISMVFVCLVAMGIIASLRIPLVLLPDIQFPGLFVFAPYNNATPQQVQESIARPIEEAVSTIPGIKRLTASSSSDSAEVGMFFDWDVNMDFLRAEVREKLDQIKNELPDDLRQIYVRTFGTTDQPIMYATIASDRDLQAEYEFLEVKIKKPVERIPGVAEVEFWGTQKHQLDIYLRLDDIKRYDVNVGGLFQQLDQANMNMSLGEIDDAEGRLGVVSRGVMSSVEEVGRFPVNDKGLRLADVADIEFDNPNTNFGQHLNGKQGVWFAVKKTSQANTVETVKAVQEVFEELKNDAAFSGIEMRVWFDAGKDITESLSTLLQAGTFGALLAVVTLFIFLRRLDASLLVGLAIPFSIITALGFIYFSGNTLNLLSMMGLMLSTGMLVDNAVVVLESIYQKLEKGYDRTQAAREGAGEVTTAVIAATLTSIIIFVPLVFGEANEFSIFLGHAGRAIIFALVCSLFISLTLIPIFIAKILHVDPNHRSGWQRATAAFFESKLLRIGRRFGWNATSSGPKKPGSGRITETYLKLVDWPLRHRFLTGFLLAPALVYGAQWVLSNHVKDNAPDPDELAVLRLDYDFSENFHYAKIEADYVVPVEEYLDENRERFKIKDHYTRFRNNNADTQIYLDKDQLTLEELTKIREELGEGLPVIPGAEIKMSQQEGGRNYIGGNLFGDDPTQLAEIGKQLRERLLEESDFESAWVGRDEGAEEVQIRMDREKARRYGVSPQDVSQILGIAVRARQMRGFRTGDGEVEMWIRLDQTDLEDLTDLRSIVVGAGQDGKPIVLEQVADFEIEKIAGRIRRENRQTYTYLNAIYTGDKKEEGRNLYKKVMNDFPFPEGYGWSFGFFTQRDQAEGKAMLFNVLLALFMVYFVMASLFESFTHPFSIMISLPFAIVGVAAMLWVTDTPYDMMAQVGSLVLIGIVVNNGIVLIDHINNLRRKGLSREDAIREGCRERLRPIVMTATTTIVGLIPLAFGDAKIGPMRYMPMARTVMGGLMASTVLTLIVLPAYYTLLDDLGRYVSWLMRSSDPNQPLSPEREAEPVAGD